MNRLRELRGTIQQKTICELLGLNQKTYSSYETEMRKIPPDVLKKLADYYNVSVGYLLGMEDKPVEVPDELKFLSVAFNGGLAGLTQEDVDDISNYVDFLKNKRKKTDK